MSMRGLVVALLCGVLGVGIGVGVGYLAQPTASHAGTAQPVPAVSPSLPIDLPPPPPSIKPDISYPTLDPTLPLPPPSRTIGNELATWTYRVPRGWTPHAVCTSITECPPPMQDDDPLTPKQALTRPEIRFRPPNEPSIGGYSLRVKILDNTLGLNTGQMVGQKIIGFRQTYRYFTLLRKTASTAYFTFIDANDHLRYNYFQWFAVPGSTTATLEMSVAGRKQDVPGLKALFNRFADELVGSDQPFTPPRSPKHPSGATEPTGSPS